FGVILTVPVAQRAFQVGLAPVGNWASNRAAGPGYSGLAGQFGLGALLGAVWSPCVGPTLGAATLLASQGEHLGAVAFVMAAFGIGAALPLLLIGTAGRATMTRVRGRLGEAGRVGKWLLGGGMMLAGLLVPTGFDKSAEIWAVQHSPEWLSEVATRF
ncbi:MAG: cytochrome c biogenesis protein CcdA, partial [Sphingomonadaceae bacterium]|nr:cytochrome c biogenesis protein CcdA [Sphingomonadaceae bacterium]